jgi:ATP-binding cassette, subfamily B, bacterial PglK
MFLWLRKMTIYKNLLILWKNLENTRKVQFLFVLILTIIAALFEIIGIGIVVPFLGVLISPEAVFNHDLIFPYMEILDIKTPKELLKPLIILFTIIVLSGGAVRLVLLYSMNRLSYSVGSDISISIYKKTLFQEYCVHISRNSSEVISGIITKTNIISNNVLSPVLIFISSGIFTISIIITIFFIDFNVALILLFGLGGSYFMIALASRRKINKNSLCIARQSNIMLKTLQEGLGGIRDILLDGNQEFYSQVYRSADVSYRRAVGNNVFISGSPKFVMESISMVFIAFLAYYMSFREGGVAAYLPILGAMTIGAQRLLPALQQVYGSYSNIRGARESLIDVVNLLLQPYDTEGRLKNYKALHFSSHIKLNNIWFKYGDVWLFKGLSLEIEKGDIVGIMGDTGSGKSTLIDIIMGLLIPTKGNMDIDDVIVENNNKAAWQKNVAHVPQQIFLIDNTIEENIAFGVAKENVNKANVINSAEKAQISEYIESLELGYLTPTGEQGVKLSGGQRQRIGIARAMYKQSELLVFDEATSALDYKTEEGVMNSIKEMDEKKTIIIVAHRLTTLKLCDYIYKIEANGVITKVIYKDIKNG